MDAPADTRSVPPAPLVAVAAWLLPGAGYWLIGQRARGTTVGVSVLTLFVLGLLVGGIRVVEVPGYNVDTGQRQIDAASHTWALLATPLNEVRNKPWSLPQLMTGPVAVVAGACSVMAAATDPNGPRDASGEPSVYPARDPQSRQPDPRAGQAVQPIGFTTHARVNEIGSLYLSVAGLLNLMAIIDAAHRAVHLSERRESTGDAAQPSGAAA